MILLTPETLVGFGISSMARTFSGSGLRPLLVIKCPINLTSFIFKESLSLFSISSAPEEYQRRQDQTVEGLPGVRNIIDDILIYGEGELC
jgi:hypothetical protein